MSKTSEVKGALEGVDPSQWSMDQWQQCTMEQWSGWLYEQDSTKEVLYWQHQAHQYRGALLSALPECWRQDQIVCWSLYWLGKSYEGQLYEEQYAQQIGTQKQELNPWRPMEYRSIDPMVTTRVMGWLKKINWTKNYQQEKGQEEESPIPLVALIRAMLVVCGPLGLHQIQSSWMSEEQMEHFWSTVLQLDFQCIRQMPHSVQKKLPHLIWHSWSTHKVLSPNELAPELWDQLVEQSSLNVNEKKIIKRLGSEKRIYQHGGINTPIKIFQDAKPSLQWAAQELLSQYQAQQMQKKIRQVPQKEVFKRSVKL